jgi:hypothetical protein
MDMLDRGLVDGKVLVAPMRVLSPPASKMAVAVHFHGLRRLESWISPSRCRM